MMSGHRTPVPRRDDVRRRTPPYPIPLFDDVPHRDENRKMSQARRMVRRAPGVAGLLLGLASFLLACGGSRAAVRPERPWAERPPDPALPRPAEEGLRPPAPPAGLLAALPAETRARIVATATGWLGRPGPFRAGGRRFQPDCSGFVEAAYEARGIPIRDAMPSRPEDEWRASAALYRASRELGVLYGAEREPLPGDLVFFENTYDRNHNGLADDGITHLGLVERVRGDGAVVFLHRGGHGVGRGVLDLRHPVDARGSSGVLHNTALRARRGRDPRGISYLAGELFAGFGRIDPARVAAVLDGNRRLDLAALGYGEPASGLELPGSR